MVSIPQSPDAIVIGAGPAGAVVARRLADDGRRVVLIEAGPGGPRPQSVVGLDVVAASAEATRHRQGLTVRDRPDGPTRPYRQGHGLGGGSMINGMLLTPGDRADYERWVGEWGCTGWGPDELAPWLGRAREAWPATELESGPVSIALAEAAGADGLVGGGNSLDGDRLGVLTASLAALNRRRWSAADAYLGGDGPGPVTGSGAELEALELPGHAADGTSRSGGGIVVLAGRPVERIVASPSSGGHEVVLEGGRSIGAPLVVVGAGALGSPALLARSEMTERPVGATLVEHPSCTFTLVLRPGAGAGAGAGVDVDVEGVAGARSAAGPAAVSTLVRWSSGPEWPGDLQAIAIDRVAPPGYQGRPLAVVAVGLMAVTARGSVRLDHAGASEPEVITGVLGTAGDRRRLRAGVRRVGRWLAADPFGDLVEAVHLDDDGRPLSDLDALADDELDRLIVSRPGPYAHPAGTCPLGQDDDPRSVTSIEPGRMGELIDRPGIRVVDSSVLPDLVRGGLQLPVTAVASRIADDIIGGS